MWPFRKHKPVLENDITRNAAKFAELGRRIQKNRDKVNAEIAAQVKSQVEEAWVKTQEIAAKLNQKPAPEEVMRECVLMLKCLSDHVGQVIPMWEGRRGEARYQLINMCERVDRVSVKLQEIIRRPDTEPAE